MEQTIGNGTIFIEVPEEDPEDRQKNVQAILARLKQTAEED